MNAFFKKYSSILFLLFGLVFQSYSQPTVSSSNGSERQSSVPDDPGGDPDNPVPIGGLEILLIGGAILGVRKVISSKKRS